MSQLVVARNYAEALLAVAKRHHAVERFGELLDAVTGAVETEPAVLAVLMSPRVTKAAKQQLFARALAGTAPEPFVRFLAGVVQRGRQGMLRPISTAYQDLVDVALNRVHAGVITAHPADQALAAVITQRLAAVVGKTVIPHFRTDPTVLGGVVVRIGDRIFDGSLRRRMRTLRHRMLHPTAGRSE